MMMMNQGGWVLGRGRSVLNMLANCGKVASLKFT